jgi:predicted signal transduction protein with EAL and GGDEF domain
MYRFHVRRTKEQVCNSSHVDTEAYSIFGDPIIATMSLQLAIPQRGALLQSRLRLASRLRCCLAYSTVDTVARLGGDEFAVMLSDLSRDAEQVALHAKTVADKILAALDHPYRLDGKECRCSASVGVTVFGYPTDSSNEIMQQVDIAQYQAKKSGRNNVHFFVPALQAAALARATIEQDLSRAIEENQFVHYYQPQVENGRITGVEALIRWKHPTRGMVMPDDFIQVAEQTRLILPIGEWGLHTACAQLAAWATRKETAHLTIAVNISAVHLRQPSFVKKVQQAIERAGADAERLRLELTESMLVENFEDTVAKMNALRARGVRFSLDDFGTGFSSLACLKRLPLDRLKIDRTFISDIIEDPASGAIARAIISLGQALGISVIAEGVETEEQRDFLIGLGCHAYQGFLLSRPLPLEEIEAFLDRSKPDTAFPHR